MPNPTGTEADPKPKRYLIVIDKKGIRLLAEVIPDSEYDNVLVVRNFYNGVVWFFRQMSDPAPDSLIASLAEQIVGVYDERSEDNHLKDRLARGSRVHQGTYEPYEHN
jgi:hypothetical protein